MKKMKCDNFMESKGITLIALVITIIVLLILAGVTITSITGENGILSKSTEAKAKTIVGQEKEQISSAYSAVVANRLGDDSVTASEIQTELDNIAGSGKTTVSGGNSFKIRFVDTNNMYTISKSKGVEEYKKEEVTPVYAFLCDTDGNGEGETLVLSSTDTIDGYTIIKSYGDSEAYESNEDNAEKNYGNIYYYPIWKDDLNAIKNAVIYNKVVPTITERWFNCSNLTEIKNIENIDTSNVTNMTCMFLNCSSITNLDLSNFDTSNVKKMISMFFGCKKLTNLNVDNFDISNVEDMNSMFSGCSSLTSLNLSSFKDNKVERMNSIFSGCENLTNLNLTNLKTNNATLMDSMFYNCKKLTNLDLKSFDTSNVTDMDDMFRECSSLTSLDLSNFNTSNVTKMCSMFSGCTNLKNLDISNFNTSNVYDMSDMFYGCQNLTSVDLSGFELNSSKHVNVRSMFEKCTQLKTIYVNSKWAMKDDWYGDNMFKNCTSLVGGAGTTFDSSHTGLEYAHIDGGTSNPGYLTEK